MWPVFWSNFERANHTFGWLLDEHFLGPTSAFRIGSYRRILIYRDPRSEDLGASTLNVALIVYIIEYWIAKIWPLYEGSISKWPRPNWRQRVWIFRNAYQFVLGQVIKQTKAWKAMKLLISAIKSILSIVLMKISTRYYRSFRITGWDWFTGLTDRPVLSRECRMIIRRLWQSWLSRGQTWNCPFTPRLNPDK